MINQYDFVVDSADFDEGLQCQLEFPPADMLVYAPVSVNTVSKYLYSRSA